MSEVVVYNSGEIELKVSVVDDTIWLTQKQLADLFEVTKQNVSQHIIAIYKENELEKNPTVKKFLTVQKALYTTMKILEIGLILLESHKED